MSAGVLKLSVEQGATYKKKLIWKDSSGALVNLTGFTARMQIRKEIADATILLELTTENGGITLGGANGEIDLLISDTDTTAITWGSGVYDLEMIDTGSEVTRLVEGKVTVSFEVTR